MSIKGLCHYKKILSDDIIQYDHNCRKTVAQMVAGLAWDQKVLGSNPSGAYETKF